MLSPRRRALSLVLLSFAGCVPDAPAVDARVDASDVPDAPAVDASRDVAMTDVTDAPSIDASVDASDASDAARDVNRDAPDASDVTPSDAGRDAVVADVADVTDVRDVTDVTDVRDVTDAPAPDPLASLGACLGATAPLTVSRNVPYVSIPIGAYRGEFALDYGSTFSSIDLAAFPAPGPRTSGCDRALLGVTCTVDGFSFFADPSPVSLVTEDFRAVAGSVRQAGIVGTDFTSLRVIALSYRASRMYVGGAAGCSDDAWRGAGFASLSSRGFFSNDLSALSPRGAVDTGAVAGAHVPNVPTVPLRVGGVSALAQLDTGFDDALVPLSVNVNAAFFSAIVAADAGTLVRDAARDLSLTTCVPGLSEPVEAWTLAPGRTLEFVSDSGAVARRYAGATLFVKRTPAAARSCGGIGTWTAPAAQVAASFFVEMGSVAFDPYTSRVWMPAR